MHPDFTAFLDHLTTLKKSPLTVRRYGDVLRDLDRFAAGREPAAITTEELRRFATAPCQGERERAPAGVNLRVAVLRGLFAYLVAERGYVGSNPAARLKGIPEKRRVPKYLTQAEARVLVEHVARASGAHARRDLALVIVMWQTGLRVAEIARLRMSQLDRDARMLRGVRVKGGHEIDVTLNAETLAVLDAYVVTRGSIDDDGAVFASRARAPISSRAIEARFETWRAQLGWTRRLHPHLLRHTFATSLLDQGAAIATVANLLGHSGLATVLVYASVLDPARRTAIEKLGCLVPRAILPRPSEPTVTTTAPASVTEPLELAPATPTAAPERAIPTAPPELPTTVFAQPATSPATTPALPVAIEASVPAQSRDAIPLAVPTRTTIVPMMPTAAVEIPPFAACPAFPTGPAANDVAVTDFTCGEEAFDDAA